MQTGGKSWLTWRTFGALPSPCLTPAGTMALPFAMAIRIAGSRGYGFPAVLVRLASIELGELEELLIDGWRCQAPKALVKAFDAGQVRRST